MTKITSPKVAEEVRKNLSRRGIVKSKAPENPRPPPQSPGELRMDTDYDPDPRGDQPDQPKR